MKTSSAYKSYLEHQLIIAVFGELPTEIPFCPWGRLQRLDGRTVAMVMQHLAGDDFTQIGYEWDLTRERCRQIFARAMTELRKP